MASPDQLRARAAALRRVAGEIEACDVRSLRRRCGDDVWIGSTATTCLEDVAVHGARLGWAVDDLRAAASAFSAQATAIESAVGAQR